jgi:hypothetical protein
MMLETISLRMVHSFPLSDTETIVPVDFSADRRKLREWP